MESIIDQAKAAYQKNLDALAAEEERRTRSSEATQRERFAFALKNVFSFPVDEKRQWSENIAMWPGTYHEESAGGGHGELRLRYELDGLTLTDTNNHGYKTLLLVRQCPVCGSEIMRPITSMSSLGQELAHEIDPVLECGACRSRIAQIQIDSDIHYRQAQEERAKRQWCEQAKTDPWPGQARREGTAMPTTFEMNDIIRRLLDLPGEIAEAEERLLDADQQRQRAADHLQQAVDRLLLTGTIDGENAEVREAQLRTYTADKELALQPHTETLARIKNELHRLQNEFAALRSVARLMAAFSNE